VIVGVAGSVAVVVIDTHTLGAISGDVQIMAGGNVLVAAQDDTTTYVIAGSVGGGLVGGAGGVAVTVITKPTEAVIGGGAAADAEGNGGTILNGMPTGAMNADGTFPATTLRGVAVQATSSEDLFALGASGAGGFAGIAGAVSVEVVDSDTLAHVIGGAEVNQNTAGSANAEQSVNVSAVNRLKLLSIDGAVGAGFVGFGASVDVGVIRNDTTAVIGGAGTKVRAKDAVDVNALARRDLSSFTISVAASGLSLAGSIAVYSVGGNFGRTTTASNGNASASQDALAGDKDGNTSVTGSVESSTSGLVGGFTANDAGSVPTFTAAAVNPAADTITLNNHGLKTGDSVVYSSTGNAIGGLENGRTYFVIPVADNTLKLPAT